MPGRLGKLLFIILLLISGASKAQEVKIHGAFIEDSLTIGQPVSFWLTASYPRSLELVFPDSSTSFAPFEFESKKYFETRLSNELAFDSAVYTLQSFEIDPIQYLRLDAIILTTVDSVVISSPLDSIYLMELAPVVSDTTRLKTNLEYRAVNRQFNFPLMYYITGGLILLIVILLLIFGRKIIKIIKIKRLEKEYRIFSEKFGVSIRLLKDNAQPEEAEKALTLWKHYQERLDRKPFSSLTTKEIIALSFAHELEAPLKSIDKVVYGRRHQEDIYQDFQQIEDFADERFQKRVAEIRNGE